MTSCRSNLRSVLTASCCDRVGCVSALNLLRLESEAWFVCGALIIECRPLLDDWKCWRESAGAFEGVGGGFAPGSEESGVGSPGIASMRAEQVPERASSI